VVFEWRRKNIENYLLIPAGWIRAIRNKLNIIYDDLFFNPYKKLIENFFGEQNLTLPKNSTWENVKANIFEIVDGKKILFEMSDSLFQQILKKFQLKINRESVSFAMTVDEIHKDIKEFFRRLEQLANEKQGQF
jgi:hypothetical protein